ncbi:MAG: hypothetical protein WC026_13030 [Hyphomicrobium sp.]|uniref:hypothetical protein n=1 Tax=Hyphomicrobium sp. TaxID=82 RepID=UPI00356B2A09
MEAENEIEKLVMILSNKTDFGSSQGGMISVKNFYKVAEDIMLWHKQQTTNFLDEELKRIESDLDKNWDYLQNESKFKNLDGITPFLIGIKKLEARKTGVLMMKEKVLENKY